MVTERLAPWIDTREGGAADRDRHDADGEQQESCEEIGREGDRERRRPAADLQNLDAGQCLRAANTAVGWRGEAIAPPKGR